MIALGYYGAEVYDISMPFPTGPLGFAKSRATIRENPGKIGVLGATKRAEVELSVRHDSSEVPHGITLGATERRRRRGTASRWQRASCCRDHRATRGWGICRYQRTCRSRSAGEPGLRGPGR